MAKTAVLVPYLDMCEMARSLIKDYDGLTPLCLEYTKTSHVAERAKELEQQGCELIIARGVQASIVRRTVRLPLVEIRVTAQEIAGVLLELKKELKQAANRPRLALIGFGNMFADTSDFDNLFEIELHRYFVQDTGDFETAVDAAVRDGCLAIVGGDMVCEKAQELHIPYRFIPSGSESLNNAFEMASTVSYAIDLGKKNSAEMDTMLNNTFSGIIQLNPVGVIQRVNRTCYQMLGVRPAELVGQPVEKVLPEINHSAIETALQTGQETYAAVVDIHHQAVVMNIAPIQVGEQLNGAIITFQEGQRVEEMGSELRRELYQRGFVAKYTFANIAQGGREDAALIRLATKMAKYAEPILISGESGTGKDMIAQCIHNESMYKGNAFVPVDCSAWSSETLDNMLFGNYTTRKDSEATLVELAQEGTLYLAHIECLPLETQYKICALIGGKFTHNGSNRPINMKVRVIASTNVMLTNRLEKGAFRKDLYYALSVLNLDVPPIRRRRNCIMPWFNFYLEEWQRTCKRYVHLTNGAVKFLEEYDWPGNLDQIRIICQRTVLLTEKRSIDEVFLRQQIEQITPQIIPGTERVVMYKDKKAVEIARLMRQYGGSREKVAEELGVSKTTLWRYIKKYDITLDYNC